MAKHLTDQDISRVCEILDNWSVDVKLTWERLVSAMEHECGFAATRQTLQKSTRIKQAFNEVKAIVAGKKLQKPKKLPASLSIAADRISSLERKVERLEQENHRLLEQFQVWLYNAHRHGVKIDQLNQPLPRAT